MSVKERNLSGNWLEPDDAPELTEEIFQRAQISRGGKVVRKATGTLTKRGRPPIGNQPKEQVTLRLPADVIAHFKAGGPGWQTRVSDVLERFTARDKRKHAEIH